MGNPDVHRLECRKEISASEHAVEVPPAIDIDRPRPGVTIYDGDLVYARERREVFERSFPEPSILMALWSNCQRL